MTTEALVEARRPVSGLVDTGRAAALVLVLMAWNAASDAIFDGLDAGADGSPWRLPLILLGTLVTVGGVVGLGCVVAGRRSLRELGWTFERPLLLVAIGLAATALVVGMVFGAYAFMGGVAAVRELATTLAAMPFAERAVFFVLGAKVAFVEETLFRGDLLRTLRARIGVVAAVILSSVVFALFHRTTDVLPLTMKLLFGLVFALTMVRTGSLWPSAIAHTLMWAIVADN